MAIHIAGLTLPGPAQLLDTVRAVTGWSAEATEIVASLPARAESLLTEVETLVRRINTVVQRAEGAVDRVDSVVTGADGAVRATQDVLAKVTGITQDANDLVGLYRPMATRAAPLAARFVDELSEGEITAAIRLVDQLPALTDHIETDILPILGTLDRVGPDINELLSVVKDVAAGLESLPGMGMLLRRGRAADD